MKRNFLVLFVLTIVAVVAAETTAVAEVIVDSLTTTIDTLVNDATAIAEAAKGMTTGSASVWLLMAAVIKMLMSAMKFKPVAKILDSPKIKQYKPYIALGLGVVAGFVTSVSMGEPLVSSLIVGATAGFGAIGIHETTKSIVQKNG